jgi:hypothetical protein
MRTVFSIVLGVLFIAGVVHAQERISNRWDRPDQWIHIQDSLWVYRYSGGDTLNDTRVSASCTFSVAYDSASRIFYRFTEPTLNSQQLNLLDWMYRRVVHATPQHPYLNSRTDNFTVHTGDTVSFFKEWSWANPITRVQDPGDYRSLDTLIYVVYLVRAADSQCIALLDSMLIMPSPQPGRPSVFGTSTIAGLMKFVVPSTMDGHAMFIGVGAFAHGPGQYNFSRRDAYTIGASRVLDRPAYQLALQDYNSRLLVR